jgi:hypothetical protein
MGGHLSFALDDVMANSLFEMLGVATGRRDAGAFS